MLVISRIRICLGVPAHGSTMPQISLTTSLRHITLTLDQLFCSVSVDHEADKHNVSSFQSML